MEGDATPQRLWLNDLAPGSTHTVTFQYGTTKGGNHAYDYLTTFNKSETWITDADRCDGHSRLHAGAQTSAGIKPDTTPISRLTRQPASRPHFTMRNGDIRDDRTLVHWYVRRRQRDRDHGLSSLSVRPNGCETKYGVTTCAVAIWFGAHVARSSEWTPDRGGAGASQARRITSASLLFDGANGGGRDNQMAANVIPPAGHRHRQGRPRLVVPHSLVA